MQQIIARYGRMNIIESDTVISRSLKMYGEWAEKEINLLKNFISAGDVVLDVGAYIGTHALAFASIVGASGKVISFEPQPEVFKILLSNILDLPQASAFNVGLGSSIAEISSPSLDLSLEFNFGRASLESFVSQSTDNSELKIATLDSMNLRKINFIKIDVEGMEEKVILGGISSILEFKPTIYIECNDLKTTSFTFNLCKKLNYRAYGFVFNAYNPENFFKNESNFFEDAAEAGILLVPKDSKNVTGELIKKFKLITLDNDDDLVSMLLHIPQYHTEVLIHSSGFKMYGDNYPAPANKTLTSLSESYKCLQAAHAELQVSYAVFKKSRIHRLANSLRLFILRLKEIFNEN